MCPFRMTGSDTLRLSEAQTKWLDGLKDGDGLSSPLSRLTTVGVRPDLLPIVVSLSRGDGLKRFLTCLATSSALREDVTGELMLMLSWGLEPAALRSLLAESPKGGDSVEIAFEILMSVSGATGTLLSTSPRTPTSGTSVGPCDHCGDLIIRGEPYVQTVRPPHTMRIYHYACLSITKR